MALLGLTAEGVGPFERLFLNTPRHPVEPPWLTEQKLALISNAGDGVLLWQVACEFVAASRKL